jgi:hypothetical protein
MGRKSFGIKKVDAHGKTIKNFKEWKVQNPGALYHDSKLEYDFYHILRKRKIKFDHKVKYTIQPAFKFTDYVTRKKKEGKITDWFECSIQPITWSPDFLLTDYNMIVECKGRENDAFPNKLKMFKYYVYMNKLNLKVVVLHSIKELENFLDKGLK